MDILNLPNCATAESDFNSGVPLCDLLKGRIRGVIYADRGVRFSAADLATIQTAIAAIKTKTAAPRGGRVYPIWDLQNYEDNTGDPTTGGVGNLSTATIVTNDAVPAFRFGYGGGEIRNKRMSAMVSGSYDVFFVDDKFSLYGVRDGDGLKGYTVLQSYVYASKFIIADAVNQYSFRMTLSDISEYRDRAGFVVLNSGVLSAQGLITFSLSELSHAANVYKFLALADGGTNLATLYPGIATPPITARRLDTGAAIAVTAQARDLSTDPDSVSVTFDATAFNALAAGVQVQVIPASATDYAAAGVKPFEGQSAIIVKP